jgi:hypothetical protein
VASNGSVVALVVDDECGGVLLLEGDKRVRRGGQLRRMEAQGGAHR